MLPGQTLGYLASDVSKSKQNRLDSRLQHSHGNETETCEQDVTKNCLIDMVRALAKSHAGEVGTRRMSSPNENGSGVGDSSRGHE
jgi:hypothetical protein